jgi:hypothetical protein
VYGFGYDASGYYVRVYKKDDPRKYRRYLLGSLFVAGAFLGFAVIAYFGLPSGWRG